MERQEILDRITKLQIERGERECGYASHGLHLSDEFERVQNGYAAKLRDLQAELAELSISDEDNE